MRLKYKATIAICTRNKKTYLEKCLVSLAGQQLGKNKVCVVIINDNSTDQTDTVIQKYIHRETARVIYRKHKTTNGTARSRNHAITLCKTSTIVFIDDDVILSRGWIRKILHVIDTHPEAALLGGGVIPKFDPYVGEVGWLSEAIVKGPAFAYIYYGPNPCYLHFDQSLITANCVINVKLLGKEAHFNELLGENEDSGIKGEDVELNWRLMKKEYPVYYHPSIAVEHLILQDRLSKKNVLYECYIWGKTESILHQKYEKNTYQKIVVSKLIEIVRVCKNLVMLKTKFHFEAFTLVAYFLGYIEIFCRYLLGKKYVY